MTERDWLDPVTPKLLLFRLLGSRVTRRKRHLIDSACWRQILPALSSESRDGLALSERYADGEVTTGELRAAYLDRKAVAPLFWDGSGSREARGPLEVAFPDNLGVRRLHARMSWILDLVECGLLGRGTGPFVEEMRLFMRGLFHELFANPFRPMQLDPAWRTEPATGIARAAYTERRFEAMPILADALEEAGCHDTAMLAHCRGPGPHVRGCWVIDWVIGFA